MPLTRATSRSAAAVCRGAGIGAGLEAATAVIVPKTQTTPPPLFGRGRAGDFQNPILTLKLQHIILLYIHHKFITHFMTVIRITFIFNFLTFS